MRFFGLALATPVHTIPSMLSKLTTWVTLLVLLGGCASDDLPTQPDRIIKVLPQYLDLEGRHALAPSLFERDAYQAWLRDNPEQVSGVRYQVQWRARDPGTYRLRLELSGDFGPDNVPRRKMLEREVAISRYVARWTSIPLTGQEYETFGPIVAWRIGLWQGDLLLAEEHSFLWREFSGGSSGNRQ